MKKIQKLLVLIALILSGQLYTACDKMPMNGDLDGMWQLMNIEYADGSNQTPDKQRYMCIQLHLVQLTVYSNAHQGIYAHFTHEGNNLRLYDYYDLTHWVNTQTTNEVLEDASQLLPWGISGLDVTYHIEKLNGNALILKDPAGTTLTFRKF